MSCLQGAHFYKRSAISISSPKTIKQIISIWAKKFPAAWDANVSPQWSKQSLWKPSHLWPLSLQNYPFSPLLILQIPVMLRVSVRILFQIKAFKQPLTMPHPEGVVSPYRLNSSSSLYREAGVGSTEERWQMQEL